jgi:hypothetical protein
MKGYNVLMGNNMTITRNGGQIMGNHNKIKGNNCEIMGNHNHVEGDNNKVTGNHNTISGNNCRSWGNDNKMVGEHNGERSSAVEFVDSPIEGWSSNIIDDHPRDIFTRDGTLIKIDGTSGKWILSSIKEPYDKRDIKEVIKIKVSPEPEGPIFPPEATFKPEMYKMLKPMTLSEVKACITFETESPDSNNKK